MEVAPRQRGPARAADPDPSWHTLYRVGAVSAALYVVLIAVGVASLGVSQAPLTDGAAVLRYIDANRLVYGTQFVAFVGLCVPAMVVFLALFAALQTADRSYAALGALIGAGSEAVALAYNSSPPSLHPGLLQLSTQYADATSDAERQGLATAAQALMVTANTVNPAGILTALGILLVSVKMRRSVCPRALAYLGVATGSVGMVAELLRDVVPFLFLVYGALLPAWFLGVGWWLHRLSRRRSDEAAAPPHRPRSIT